MAPKNSQKPLLSKYVKERKGINPGASHTCRSASADGGRGLCVTSVLGAPNGSHCVLCTRDLKPALHDQSTRSDDWIPFATGDTVGISTEGGKPL